MSHSDTGSAEVLENVLPRYRAEGFEVYVNPSPSILPPFMQEYRPDAIALRSDKKIAIEVVRAAGSSKSKVHDLRSLFAPHREWELKVLYVSTMEPGKAPNIASPAAIADAIRRVDDLKNGGYLLPALVMAWATLEATGRALSPERLRRPQTPGRLVEVLAQEGYLTPEEADSLRPAIPVRNEVVHGDLDLVIDEKQLDQFVAVLRTLVGILSRDKAPIA
jgi:uncharacterized protein YutE (UPF0331/DUF86 family)